MTIQAVRGMKDVLPDEVYKWQELERIAREVFMTFGYAEIKTPVVEKTGLFKRSIGETTDVVEKEMYTFTDRSGDMLTLRPEATAGILRSYVEHKTYGQPGPHKLFAIGPMFRHERPQKGRLRQFTQLDVEALDDDGPMVDAEMMIMLVHLLNRLGLTQISLLVNSLGCHECRPAFRKALIDFFSPKLGQLCEDCRRRLEKNPLRVLDCKVESCSRAAEGAPKINDYYCPDCKDHFQAVTGMLDRAGISYTIDHGLVRGLDYYVRTTFEAVTGDLGSQNAVTGGGRYDGLVETLGGPAKNAIGFAMGVERLIMLMPEPENKPAPRVYFAALGDEAMDWAFEKVQKLRMQGIWAEMANQKKSLKAQMRKANKLGAAQVVIVGDEELKEGKAVLKDMMGDQEQRELALEELFQTLSQKGA